MKKALVLIAALGGTLLTTGCGWMTCNKDVKSEKKTTTTTVEKNVEKADSKADSAE